MPRTFKISEAHMAAFSEQQRKRFEDEMVVYLNESYPVKAKKYSEKGLRDMIRDGIDKAKGYNITRECDLARYIELMLVLSPDFDENEKTTWAKEVLTQRRATGDFKINRIYEHLMFAGNEEVAKQPAVVPRPLNQEAASQAGKRLQIERPELSGRRLTMEPADAAHRRRWVELYREEEVAL